MCDTCAFLFLCILKMQRIASKHSWKPLGSFRNYRRERNVWCQLSSVSQRGGRGPRRPGSLTPELQLSTENSGHRKATSKRSAAAQMSDTINPSKRQQKHVVRGAQRHQPGRRTRCLFRRPTPDSASCNLKECQSGAEVQSSLKGPTP